MKTTKTTHPEWALRQKKAGTELRFIKGHYYLYEVSSIYDKEKKRAKKITGSILGKITELDGFVPSKKKVTKIEANLNQKVYCREYGLSRYLTSASNDVNRFLEDSFPEYWQIIKCLVYCRLGWQSPLKNAPFLLNNSSLKQMLPIDVFNEKSIRETLMYLGKNRNNIKKYMHNFVHEGAYNLIDATEFFSKSKNIFLAQKGYNKDMVFDDQISLLYLYSATEMMPTFYKLLAGNLREVKTMSLTIRESKIKNAVIIGDKGFYSKNNIKELKDNQLNFIIPLKRDNKGIDYSAIKEIDSSENYFKFKDRYIYYSEMIVGEDKCILYFDGKLKEQEKNDYLNRIKTLPEKFSHDKFLLKLRCFGTIALLNNLEDNDPEKLFTTYKSRANIEQMFDSLKNELDADRSYMQKEEMLEGWMFINHIALQYRQILYNKLKDQNLISKYSVSDVLMFLKHINQINVEGKWHTTEVTAQTAKLLKKINVDIT